MNTLMPDEFGLEGPRWTVLDREWGMRKRGSGLDPFHIVPDAEAGGDDMIVRKALTRRQHEVLGLVARGYTAEGIGNELGISPQTARTHLQGVMTRLEVRTRAQASAMWAAEEAERMVYAFMAPSPGARRYHQRVRDLELVVRDQRAHIASMEEQLLGQLAPGPIDAEQESLL